MPIAKCMLAAAVPAGHAVAMVGLTAFSSTGFIALDSGDMFGFGGGEGAIGDGLMIESEFVTSLSNVVDSAAVEKNIAPRDWATTSSPTFEGERDVQSVTTRIAQRNAWTVSMDTDCNCDYDDAEEDENSDVSRFTPSRTRDGESLSDDYCDELMTATALPLSASCASLKSMSDSCSAMVPSLVISCSRKKSGASSTSGRNSQTKTKKKVPYHSMSTTPSSSYHPDRSDDATVFSMYRSSTSDSLPTSTSDAADKRTVVGDCCPVDGGGAGECENADSGHGQRDGAFKKTDINETSNTEQRQQTQPKPPMTVADSSKPVRGRHVGEPASLVYSANAINGVKREEQKPQLSSSTSVPTAQRSPPTLGKFSTRHRFWVNDTSHPAQHGVARAGNLCRGSVGDVDIPGVYAKHRVVYNQPRRRALLG